MFFILTSKWINSCFFVIFIHCVAGPIIVAHLVSIKRPSPLCFQVARTKSSSWSRGQIMSKEVSVEAEQPPAKDYSDPPPAPLLGLGELRLWSFYRALIAEFVATLLFLYVTIATVIGHKEQNAVNQCDGVGVLGIAWAFGGMIFILVYCTAGISGSQSASLLSRPLNQVPCSHW